MTDDPIPLPDRLKAAQEKARQARSEAFVNYAPIVAGEVLNPITLDSYNALIAFGNAFVTGGAIGFDDIANFVWLHHPQFGQFNREGRKRVTRRVYAALKPRVPTLNELAILFAQFPRCRFLRRVIVKTAGERASEAIQEIRRLLLEATVELPRGSDEGEPMPYAFQAYLLNLFRSTLGMTFAETRAVPLKQLAQHYREIVHRESKGKAILLTDEEAAIWREHLGAKQ